MKDFGTSDRLIPVASYLRSSLTASSPACAHCSSWSAVPPLTPIPPSCALFAVIIGSPPAKVITPGTSAMPGTVPGLPSLPKASSWKKRVEAGNFADVIALRWEIYTLPKNAPSMRSNITRLAPSSAIAMFIFQPSCFALASHPATIFFATSSVRVGFVSIPIATELQRIAAAATAIAPLTRQNAFILTSQFWIDGLWIAMEAQRDATMRQTYAIAQEESSRSARDWRERAANEALALYGSPGRFDS